ncbi:MAG: protein kinase [Elusimicrobiota bacterium]
MRPPLFLLGVLVLLPSAARAFECDVTDGSTKYGGYEKTLDACGLPNPARNSKSKAANADECARRLVPVLIRCQRKEINNEKDCVDNPNCTQLPDRIKTLLDFAQKNPDVAERSQAQTNKLNDDDQAALNMLLEQGLRTGVKGDKSKTEAPGHDLTQTDDGNGNGVHPTAADATRAYQGGDTAGAQKIIAQDLKKNPDDAQALALRAQLREESGDHEGALADAKRAAELNPEDAASRRLATELQSLSRAQSKVKSAKLDFGAAPDAGAGAGGANRGEGRGFGPARAAARIAPGGGAPGPAVAPSPVDVPSQAVQTLLQAAEAKMRIGDFTGALLTLQQARELDPKSPAVWDMIADANARLGDFAGAIAAANEALKLNSNDAKALRLKAYAEIQTGDFAAAFADADRAVRLDPQNGLGFLYRAMAEEKLGRTADALRDYAQAQALDPTLGALAQAGLKRLGGDGAAPSAAPVGRALFRGGAIAAASLLILLGLLGAGARAITKKRRLTTAPPAPGEENPAVPPTVAVGTLLDGHYRVTRELGRGGMGVVYHAFDEKLRRPVAIKQLQRDGRASREDTDRFLREARLVAQLKHPHVAEIYSVIGDSELLLVFEYVDGKPLSDLLGAGKPLPPDAARRIVTDVASALDAAHALKITHRDLKPANVMLTGSGAAKVMDFGIAHQSLSGADLTKTAWAAGTPPYMAPEQAMGSVSKASDVFALGVMTYELLTGRRPFDGPDYVEQKLRGQYVPASALNASLPRETDAILAAALDPDPTKRPVSAGEFSRGLARALGATPSRA